MNSISLRICGNKSANSGFSVLVDLGSPSPDVKDMAVMPGLIENEYYFFIRHESNRIVYTVQKTRIRSYGAARDGRLIMAIAVPRGLEVEAASPYDVLMDVYNTFVSRYTTDSLGGTQFSNADVDASVFQGILDRYRLVPARNRYLAMAADRSARAFVLLPSPRQIAELMRDSQYTEFLPYGEIIVAQEGSTAYPRLSVTVPRPVRYKVFVNGTLSPTEITSLTEPFTATAEIGDCYESIPVCFTLADLKAGRIPPEVKIDVQNEAVHCTLGRKPKTQDWRLVLEGDHPAFDQIALRDKRSGEMIPVDSNGQFQLTGTQIVSQLEVASKDPSFVKNGSDVRDNVNRVVTGRFLKRRAGAPVGRPVEGPGQTVSIKVFPENFKDHRIDLYLEGNRKTLVIPDIRVNDRNEAVVDVPVSFFPNGGIMVSAQSKHYETTASVRFEPEKERDIELRFSRKKRWGDLLKTLGVALACAGVGVLAGWLCFRGDGEEKSDNQRHDPPKSDTEKVLELAHNLKQLEKADRTLEIKDAENIVKMAGKFSAEDLQKASEAYQAVLRLKPCAEAYGAVLEVLDKKGSFNTEDKRFEKDGEVGKLLTEEIRAALQATYFGLFGTGKYEPEEAEHAWKEYQKRNIGSFEDLYRIGVDIKGKIEQKP